MAFYRRFFRKMRRPEPTGGPDPFRPAFTMGCGLASVSGDLRIRSLYQSVFFSSTVLPFAKLPTNRYPVLSGPLRAWRLRRPDCLAQFASAFSASSMLSRFSGVAPSTICWSSIRYSCDGSVPAHAPKSCDQSLYVLSLYDRVQPAICGSAKNEQGNRDQTWAACQKKK